MKDIFIFSIIGSKGENIKRIKKDKVVTKVTSMFFRNTIKVKEQNIKNVINDVTSLLDLKVFIFFVSKKFEKIFKNPTDPINNPICCVFKLMTSLSQTGK